MSEENTITERIHAMYERDERIPHPNEIAIFEQAGAVTLRGTVSSPRQQRAAVHIAKAAHGVTSVSDELRLDPRDHREDGEIRAAALRALLSDPEVAERVDVTVADGWLTLKGEVKHQTDSDEAYNAVRGLSGVGGITNEIKVVTAGIP